jgi:hypothetical protein
MVVKPNIAAICRPVIRGLFGYSTANLSRFERRFKAAFSYVDAGRHLAWWPQLLRTKGVRINLGARFLLLGLFSQPLVSLMFSLSDAKRRYVRLVWVMS